MKRHMNHLPKVFLLFLIIFICFTGCQKKPAQNEIILGAIMPLTGDAAVYGQNCLKGIELAVEEINSVGGVNGKHIKLVVEDSQLEPKNAVAAFGKLVSIKKVVAIIGPLASSCAMATAPVANQKEIVSFSPGASTPSLTDAGPFVFRNWQSDALEAVVMAEYAFKQGWKKFAVFYVNNDFGVALKDYFSKTVHERDGEILITETFDQGSTDYRTQITKIKGVSPDAIYLLSYPQSTPVIVNQMKALGIKAQILGVAAFEDPSLIEIAGVNAEGILYTKAIPPSGNNPILEKFNTYYQSKYGEAPGLISDTGYDAVYILVKAIQESDKITGKAIQATLTQIKKYNGASGQMTFDENGDVKKPIGIKTIDKGEFVSREIE